MFTVKVNKTFLSCQRVRALNVKVLYAYVDVIYGVDLNSKLQMECIPVYLQPV